MNLVEQLRSRCKDLGERYHRSPDEVEPDLWKAADEIERLRAALEAISITPDELHRDMTMEEMAIEALECSTSKA